MVKEDVLHADETVLKCLDEKDNKNNYMWLYATGEKALRKIILYDYQKSRANKHPEKFLKNFTGFLQTDGYAGYNKVSYVTRLGCLAHARRYYTDALKALPEDAELSRSKANEALKFFTKIYRLEGSYKNLTCEERHEKRMLEVKPIMEAYRSWLDEEAKKTLPKSKLGEAIKYSLNQWQTLIVFLEDGRLSCDNNLAERCIKPFVLARKKIFIRKIT